MSLSHPINRFHLTPLDLRFEGDAPQLTRLGLPKSVCSKDWRLVRQS